MTYPTGPPLQTFLRGYFHLKSADWDINTPHPLPGWTAEALQVMPRYYIMDLHDTMRQAVERDMSARTPKRSRREVPAGFPIMNSQSTPQNGRGQPSKAA